MSSYSFADRVAEHVKKIPYGKVTSYGYIASLAGSPRGAIAVGQILHNFSEKYGLPWQRVINYKGFITTSCLEHPANLQAQLLRKEGIKVERKKEMYWVNLADYGWEEPGS